MEHWRLRQLERGNKAASKIAEGLIEQFGDVPLPSAETIQLVRQEQPQTVIEVTGCSLLDSYKRPIGTIVRAWRENQGMSQTDLAEATGMTKQTLSELELKTQNLYTLTRMQEIADGLGINPIILAMRRLPGEISISTIDNPSKTK